MKAISKSARKVFDDAIARLGAGTHVRIDNKPDVYIPLVVEMIGTTQFAGVNPEQYALYSFCHYGVQNGDAMRDPEVVMMQHPTTKELCPISWRNDYVGVNKDDVVYDQDGHIKGYRPRQQSDNASFCNMWAKNLKDQQGLGKAVQA